MAIRINADGTTEDAVPIDGRSFTLDEMHSIVGGYIEFVYLEGDGVMVCNEEGWLRDLPLNRVASLIAGQPIAGDVLVGKLDHPGQGNERIY